MFKVQNLLGTAFLNYFCSKVVFSLSGAAKVTAGAYPALHCTALRGSHSASYLLTFPESIVLSQMTPHLYRVQSFLYLRCERCNLH